MSFEANLAMLTLTYDLMKELSDEVVFVGGATTCLYVDADIAMDIRPTEDVDCTIEIATLKDYNSFETRLRDKGFKNDVSKGAPICRFRHGDRLILDVMPNDPGILGFSNPWYKDGVSEKIIKDLDGRKISIFPLPYFLASKFEAHQNRGSNDPRMSWDLEDIILVLDGIKELKTEDFPHAPVNEFLAKMALKCNNDDAHSEAVEGFLGNNEAKINKMRSRFDFFQALTK